MKSILLIGLGRFGKHIALHLNHLGHQVMAVDTSEERVEAVLPLVTNAQIGDSTNADFLESLGVRNYDVCIVAIGSNFQSSLETTSLLSELGARFVVSRAATDVQEKFLLRNGANEVVYPEKQLAKWTAIRYSADHILDYIELDENHAMFEIPIPKDWADHSIGELDIRKKFNINIMGIKKSGKLCDSRRDFQHAAEQGRGGTKRMQIHQKSGQNGKQDDVSAKLCNDFKSVHDRGVQQVSFGSLF